MKVALTNIRFVVKWDDVYYLARCLDLPIYAVGKTSEKALINLQKELEDLYGELRGRPEEELSDRWIKYRESLNSMMEDEKQEAVL